MMAPKYSILLLLLLILIGTMISFFSNAVFMRNAFASKSIKSADDRLRVPRQSSTADTGKHYNITNQSLQTNHSKNDTITQSTNHSNTTMQPSENDVSAMSPNLESNFSELGEIPQHNSTGMPSVLHTTVKDTADPSPVNSIKSSKSYSPSQKEIPKGLKRPESDITIPRNMSLVFVGDSVMRFQYLSLIYYLHTGRWITDKDKPNLMVQQSFENWKQFYIYSTAQFHGKETCDCYRNLGPLQNNASFENRHYLEGGHALSFIRKSGWLASHGHWTPEEAFSPIHPLNYEARGKKLALWTETTWTGLIRNYIAKIIPKPNFVIFNAGIWKHDLNETTFSAIRQALDDVGIPGIYKTTTRRLEAGPEMEPHDVLGCQMVHYCLDMSWTGHLRDKKYYSDGLHFTAEPNRVFNEQLLKLLEAIRSRAITENPIVSKKANNAR